MMTGTSAQQRKRGAAVALAPEDQVRATRRRTSMLRPPPHSATLPARLDTNQRQRGGARYVSSGALGGGSLLAASAGGGAGGVSGSVRSREVIERLHGYELLDRIGEGSFSEVFLAVVRDAIALPYECARQGLSSSPSPRRPSTGATSRPGNEAAVTVAVAPEQHAKPSKKSPRRQQLVPIAAVGWGGQKKRRHAAVYYAVKRLFKTNSPERIYSELVLMGCLGSVPRSPVVRLVDSFREVRRQQ